jgi:enediyne biosynthesis protein E4
LKQAGTNRDAIGAWGEVDLGARIIREELTVGAGHASGHLGWMHFGLGSASRVKLRVQWPSGAWGPWQTVAADGFYVVDRERGTSEWTAP